MGWWDVVFDNAYKMDCKEAEEQQRLKYPLLLHKDEKIEMAFKNRGGKGRDKEFFTSHRIIMKDGKGIGSKRKNYKSIPYSSIQAFSIQTAGKCDDDSELKVWSTGIPVITIDFASSQVNVYNIQQYLNSKISWGASKGTQDVFDPIPPNMDVEQSALGNAIDWLGDNSKQIETEEVEKMFKIDSPMLLKNENVMLAFRCGRDTCVLTDKRVFLVDVKGIFGKKIEFLTIPWGSIHAYSVQTAGAFFDRDTEMFLYTNIVEKEVIIQEFRNGKADLFAIQKVLCNLILGDDTEVMPDVDLREGKEDEKGNWFLRGDQRPLDAVEMDQLYHSDPPILQGCERVEFAFMGRRNMTMFTTKRLIMIDPKGLTGKQIEYLSVPWENIVAFGVCTAGKYLDWDTEVWFHTEMAFHPGRAPCNDNPGKPATPYVSFFEISFNKNLVDLFQLKHYLSKRILLLHKMELGAPIPMDALTNEFDRPEAGIERIWQWLGGDQREIDPAELDSQLHTNTHILLDEEKVLMAFKAGRDVSIFTNLRVMILDVQGLSGKKIEYTSIPYKSIRGFAVESAGVWDRDSELHLYTRNRWTLSKVSMDFRTGKADIIQINKFLSALIVGLPTDAQVELGEKDYGAPTEAQKIGVGSITAAFFQNSSEIDSKEIETRFRTKPKLLLDEEFVLRAFEQGRDMYVYTTRRIIIVDTKGINGKSVRYKTVPYKWITGYEFETHGNFDGDAEIYSYADVTKVESFDMPRRADVTVTKQSILVKNFDIYEMGKLFTEQLLFGNKYEFKYEAETDIVVG